MSDQSPLCLTCGSPLISDRLAHCSTHCYRQAVTDSAAGAEFWSGIRAMTARGGSRPRGRSSTPSITGGSREDLLLGEGR